MVDWKKHYLKFVAAATVNVAIFVGYRVYIHKLKNKIADLTSEHESILHKIKLDLSPLLIKDFKKHQNLLSKFNFIKEVDEIAEFKIALFDYKGYIFAVRKYNLNNKEEYTVLTEISKMIVANISVEKLTNEFLSRMSFNKVPTVWINQYYKQFEVQKEVKPKYKRRIRVKIEKEIKQPDEK